MLFVVASVSTVNILIFFIYYVSDIYKQIKTSGMHGLYKYQVSTNKESRPGMIYVTGKHMLTIVQLQTLPTTSEKCHVMSINSRSNLLLTSTCTVLKCPYSHPADGNFVKPLWRLESRCFK